MDTRFADTGDALYDLATHFVVRCPKCDGRAFVGEDKRLVCTACFHTETEGRWYGAATAYVSVKCRDCHAKLTRSAPWNGEWKKLSMHCDSCGDDCEYKASISRHSLHNGRMTDSVFGLPLWYQKPFRDELFWAFNVEHLELLEKYVAAKLRERGTGLRKNSSMTSRLPEFIQKASNRPVLLKLIDLLKKQ